MSTPNTQWIVDPQGDVEIEDGILSGLGMPLGRFPRRILMARLADGSGAPSRWNPKSAMKIVGESVPADATGEVLGDPLVS